jgi:hypothetical protein
LTWVSGMPSPSNAPSFSAITAIPNFLNLSVLSYCF